MEPPTQAELELINTHTTLMAALRIKTQTKAYFKKLAEKRITALAFEYIRDSNGTYPAVTAMSEIAGTASVLIAAEILSSPEGKGLIFGNITGVPPLNVVILGAGTVGRFAAKTRSEEHTSELQSRGHLVCRLLLEKK